MLICGTTFSLVPMSSIGTAAARNKTRAGARAACSDWLGVAPTPVGDGMAIDTRAMVRGYREQLRATVDDMVASGGTVLAVGLDRDHVGELMGRPI